MKKLIFACFLVLLASPAWSQNGERVKALKVTYITNRLDLSAREAEQFWPIYNKHEKQENALRKKYRFSGSLLTISDEEANEAVENYLTLEEKLFKLKRDFIRSLQDIVPSRKIMLLNKAEKEFKQELLKILKERRRNED